MDIGSQLIGLSNLLGGAVEEDHGDDDIVRETSWHAARALVLQH